MHETSLLKKVVLNRYSIVFRVSKDVRMSIIVKIYI